MELLFFCILYFYIIYFISKIINILLFVYNLYLFVDVFYRIQITNVFFINILYLDQYLETHCIPKIEYKTF